jgi:putative phosphoribosyl transferase
MIELQRKTGAAEPFLNREDAGRQLAVRLLRYRADNPIVLGLPRGGVAIGYEVSRTLGAPLDVWVARKLGVPFQREVGIGAVAPGGVCVLDRDTIMGLGLSQRELEPVVREELAELDRRLRRYRGSRRPPEVRDQTVILVDDGLATGVTALAAVRSLRRLQPRRLILAVPVCSPAAAAALRPEVDDLVSLLVPPDFMAVGLWYQHFDQLSDQQVMNLLERAGQRRRSTPAAIPSASPVGGASAAGEPVASGPVPAPAGPDAVGESRAVRISVESGALEGSLTIPAGARGLVLYAHGSGSSRHSPRNRAVAQVLQAAGFATLLIDLLTPAEGAVDERTGHLRFDVGLLAGRLGQVLDWLAQQPETRDLAVGLFGASTGAAAALVAAAERPGRVSAVVSRGGRPDLAALVLRQVTSPTLLLVGERDEQVLELNRLALELLGAQKKLVVIPGASHLFEEPGALERVAVRTRDWFLDHLGRHPEAPVAAPPGRVSPAQAA